MPRHFSADIGNRLPFPTMLKGITSARLMLLSRSSSIRPTGMALILWAGNSMRESYGAPQRTCFRHGSGHVGLALGDEENTLALSVPLFGTLIGAGKCPGGC